MTNLDSIFKSRDITLPKKVRLVKAMVFPVVMYGCESWTVKKAERQRIDVFQLWCWRRLLRVPWTAGRSNQSILKEISPGISLEGMILKLKLQYFGHFMRRVDSLERLWCWEGLGAGGEEDDRGWDGWMASLTRWTWVWVNSGSWWWTGRPGVLRFMGSQRVGHDWATDLIWSDVFGSVNGVFEQVFEFYWIWACAFTWNFLCVNKFVRVLCVWACMNKLILWMCKFGYMCEWTCKYVSFYWNVCLYVYAHICDYVMASICGLLYEHVHVSECRSSFLCL